ncbi:flagellar hook-basal body complex protein FliE [Glycocaulis sp.]
MDLAAIRAYAAAARQAAGASEPGVQPPADPSGVSAFGNMVMTALNETQEVMRTSENLTAQSAAGQAELVDVVTAMAAAEVQLETVISVRDQVIRAYQEILRMPI